MRQVLLALTVFFAITSFAQKVKKERFSFNYIQNPEFRLGKDYTFDAYIIDKGEQAYQDKLRQWELDRQRAEQNYNERLGIWQRKCDREKELFDLRMEEYYLAKKNGQYVKTPPPLVLPEQPIFIEPPRPIEPQGYDKEGLALNFLCIDGFENTLDSKIKYEITLHGFKYSAPRRVVKERTGKRKDGSTYKYNEYAMEIRFKHPMSVRIFERDGEVFYSRFYNRFDRDKVVTSRFYSTIDELERKVNPNRMLFDQEHNLLESQIREIATEINFKYGYPTMSEYTTVYVGKSKKYDYSSLIAAYDNAKVGYQNLIYDPIKGKKKLVQAIGGWKQALKSAQPKSKKARINRTVTIGLYFNLARAHMWLNQFDKAEDALSAARVVPKIPQKDIKTIEAIRNRINAMRNRYPNRK